MTQLIQIIKEDFIDAANIVKNATIGALQGIYTPALLNTGLRQLTDVDDRYDLSAGESTARTIAQIGSAVGVHFPLALYAIEQGKELEYFGALALTNVIDYLVHVYKRSKE